MGQDTMKKELPEMSNPKDLLGAKKAALRFVPPALSIVAAPAMSEGAHKYGQFNWRDNKVFLSIYIEAILRHVYAIMDGEDVDPDSGHLHWSHIGANVGIVADALYSGNLIDDRPTPGPAAKMLDEQNQGKRVQREAEGEVTITDVAQVRRLRPDGSS